MLLEGNKIAIILKEYSFLLRKSKKKSTEKLSGITTGVHKKNQQINSTNKYYGKNENSNLKTKFPQ